jgi:hypothetical protein
MAVNIGIILLAFLPSMACLSSNLGTARSKNISLHQVLFNNTRNLNWLSLARLLLFGSRDLWFEVPLPFFLRSPPCPAIHAACDDGRGCPEGTFCAVRNATLDGVAGAGDASTCEMVNPLSGCGGLGLEMHTVGIALALYIVAYGQMQAFTPRFVLKPLLQSPPNKYVEIVWGFLMVLPPLLLGLFAFNDPAFFQGVNDVPHMEVVIFAGVSAFAILFAINSSIHSYLVLR